MTSTVTTTPAETLRLALIPSAILVMILFFLDEGWYSFRWILDWGNWIVFIIYMLLVTPVFWLMMHVLFPAQRGSKKLALVSVTAFPVLFLLACHLFMN